MVNNVEAIVKTLLLGIIQRQVVGVKETAIALFYKNIAPR